MAGAKRGNEIEQDRLTIVYSMHIAMGYLIDHEQMFSVLLLNNDMKMCHFQAEPEFPFVWNI